MITLVEGLLYLYPHRQEIVADHPAMKGVWGTCRQLLKSYENSFLAPLLVDDISRDGAKVVQSIESVVGKSYQSLPWFGHPVLESKIAQQYGNLGCKMFDALYHRDVLLALMSLSREWRWIVVHPITFKEQQEGMLLDLYKLVHGNINWGHVARNYFRKSEEVLYQVRETFFTRFTHHWINDAGEVAVSTKPTYHKKKVFFEDLGCDVSQFGGNT